MRYLSPGRVCLSGALILGAALAACGGSGTTQPAGSFTISAPLTLTVQAGAGGTLTITITRTGSFTGVVTLTLLDAPAGVTGVFTPSSVPGGTGSATLVLTIVSTLPAGSHTIRVCGNATGQSQRCTTVTLTVTPQPTGGFTLAVDPPTVGLWPGQWKTYYITLSRTAPFIGAVNLALEGLPAGASAAFSRTVIPEGATTAEFRVSVLATVPPSSYQLSLRGTAAGVPDQATPLTLAVSAPAQANVTLQTCDPSLYPVWAAYNPNLNLPEQWTQALITDGRISVPILGPTGGLALVRPRPGGTGFDLVIILATRDELIEAGTLWCGVTPVTKNLSGSVAGRLPNVDWISVSLGEAWAGLFPSPTATTPFDLTGVPLGPSDLVATQIWNGGAKLIIRRQTDYPAGGVIPVLDFGSAEAVAAPLTMTITVLGIGGEQYNIEEHYVTAGGTLGSLMYYNPTWGNVSTCMVVPPALALPGEVYSVRAEAYPGPGQFLTRSVTAAFSGALNPTLTLGPALNWPTWSFQASPWFRMSLVTNLQPEYGQLLMAGYVQPTRSGGVWITSAYLGGSAVNLTTPDLSEVPGWQGTWGPLTGVDTDLSFVGYGWTGQTTSLFPLIRGNVIVEPGVVAQAAWRHASITP